MPTRELEEVDDVGRPIAMYVAEEGRAVPSGRVDIIPSSKSLPIGQRALAVFLPSGYPKTVSSDYTTYQIYDSLQAFSSTIANLLASRAVLQGLGVGDENASATSAMLLSVLQESMGRLATILFAHFEGKGVEAECKMYRLAADVFNDLAMVLDCLSPMFPKPVRVPLLGASSVFRAICGVAGGSSKATLSAHFAQADNIGELNAKDSSQETIISLLGMWAGGVVISNVTSNIATWVWLIGLLAVHLATNYAAVCAVSMRTLNRQRCNIVFSALIAGEVVLSPEQASKQERIFERDGLLRWQGGLSLGYCQIGQSLGNMFLLLGGTIDPESGAIRGLEVPIGDVMEIFNDEEYFLWFDPDRKQAAITLKTGATAESQLKAWSHALRVAQVFKDAGDKIRGKQGVLPVLKQTLRDHNQSFGRYLNWLGAAGWNTSTPSLETKPGLRLRLGN